MRNIDKINLINVIGRELQSRMTYSDIDVFLKGFGIDANAKTEGDTFGSKWVYSKKVLADEPDDMLLSIADELELEHSYGPTPKTALFDSKFWFPNHFRLFLSHLSSFKAKTSELQKVLKNYGISGFVAHEDIEPTKEWLTEIEKALFSMDALVSILMPGFHESNWTDHEVGVAVGRDVLVIPIRRGLDPYGFIGKYQGLQAINKNIGQVASAIFDVILSNQKTKGRILDCLIDQFLLSSSVDDASHWLNLIGKSKTLPQKHGDKIIENFSSSDFVSTNEIIRKSTNKLLEKHNMSPVHDSTTDDEIPF